MFAFVLVDGYQKGSLFVTLINRFINTEVEKYILGIWSLRYDGHIENSCDVTNAHEILFRQRKLKE